MKVLFFVFLSLFHSSLASQEGNINAHFKSQGENEKDVIDALEQGEMNLEKKEADELVVKSGVFPHSQQANKESQELQRSGDLLLEASKLLVQKWGTQNLSNLSNIDITPFIENSNLFLKRRSRRAAKCAKESTNCSLKHYKQYRSITGICNNLLINPTLGKAVTPTRRLLFRSSYTDGVSAMRNMSVLGGPLPGAREISNALFDERGKPVESNKVTHFHMQFGQFVAHDLIFMPSSTSYSGEQLDCSLCSSAKTDFNCQPIPIPENDKYFKKRCLAFTRALNGQKTLGVRTQINQNTHFLDLSSVYGSEECEAASVRSFKNGELRYHTTPDNYVLPPQDTNDTYNVCQSKSPNFCFIAGDFRNSLQPGLIPLHTTYIKEHNNIAKLFKQYRPYWTDERIFQETRRIMIGRHQHHVYAHYLPTLLSAAVLTDFGLWPLATGSHKYYEPTVSPTLSTEFAAAAFRFGHSQARKEFSLLTNKYETAGPAVNIGQNIFYTESLYGNRTCSSMMNGMILTPAMKVDRQFSDPIRNQLFELRGQKGSGVDLSAINIMRGRDVGLLPYNQYRQKVGFFKAKDFDDLDLEMTSADIKALRSVYKSVEDIDLYVGILSEKPLPGTVLGPTAQHIIADTFFALKKGDRFFYENQVPGTRGFTHVELEVIRRSTPAQLLCSTNDDMERVPENVFLVNSHWVSCEQLPSFNIFPFLAAIGV